MKTVNTNNTTTFPAAIISIPPGTIVFPTNQTSSTFVVIVAVTITKFTWIIYGATPFVYAITTQSWRIHHILIQELFSRIIDCSRNIDKVYIKNGQNSHAKRDFDQWPSHAEDNHPGKLAISKSCGQFCGKVKGKIVIFNTFSKFYSQKIRILDFWLISIGNKSFFATLKL